MREGGECLPGADVSVFIRRDYSDLTQRIEPSNVPPRCLFIHSDIIIAAQPQRCSDCVDTRMHTKLQSVEGMEKLYFYGLQNKYFIVRSWIRQFDIGMMN